MDEKELTIIDDEESTENDTVELNKVKSIYLPDLTLDEICFDTIKPKENKKKTTEEILQEIEDFKNALYPTIEETEWYKEIEKIAGGSGLIRDMFVQMRIDRTKELIKEMEAIIEKREKFIQKVEALLKEMKESDDTNDDK